MLEENLELAVDERITQKLSADEVNMYCALLIQCAEYATTFHESTPGISFVKNRIHMIKRRLEHILHYQKSKVKNLIAGILAGAMVLLIPINVYASSEGIKRYYEEKAYAGYTVESSNVPVQSFTESALDLTDYQVEGTFSLVRGSNPISRSINAKSSVLCTSMVLYKGDTVHITLSGSPRDASFSLMIGTKEVRSSNGSLNAVYEIPADGAYTFVRLNHANSTVNIMGFIDIN